jgi:alkanesulfonate monooxygenase SsuD/methylene tetrahydromethanopterin reductase-like flavin-dependent oxidoreductase (luciferase family)
VRRSLLLNLAGPLADAVAVARAAEAAGLDAVHVIEGGREAFVPAATIAAATTRIGIGTYVVNAYARTPWLTAVSALDLDEVSGGRFSLGVGTGNRHLVDWSHGLEFARPVAKMREYLAVVTAMVRARAGESVEVEGDIHRTRWRAGRDPVRPALPVVLAAAGPRLIEVAAAGCDGVGVGILVSPDHLAGEIRPRARRAAEAAGRDPDAVQFPMAAMTCVDDDVERAYATVRHAIVRLFHPVPHPYYDYLLRAQGYGAVADAAARLVPAGQVRDAMAQVPDEVVERLTLTGGPEAVARRIDAYRGLADEVLCLDVRAPGPDGVPSGPVIDALALAG